MPHSKRPRLLPDSANDDENPAVAHTDHDDDDVTTADKLSGDEVAIIFSFLPMRNIMCLRRVCTTWRDATKKTIVPRARYPMFRINCVEKYNAVRVMTTALPNLLEIRFWGDFKEGGHKYIDGQDPNEEKAAETANHTAYDIEIISNFRKLRFLHIFRAPLNGRYPSLFNFPLLEHLFVYECNNLKWDLDILQGLPILKQFSCSSNRSVSGSLNSLRVLKDTLEKVNISHCPSVSGSLMDLADFPRLKELELREINVSGDIQDIGENDFPALETLCLPDTVYGGDYYEFQSIAKVSDFMSRIYPLAKQRDSKLLQDFHWQLSRDSPDWYWYDGDDDQIPPPFDFELIIISSRIGWRWKSTAYFSDDDDSMGGGVEEINCCEINWLDPEPDRESDDYIEYIHHLDALQDEMTFYRGYYQPPTEDEYYRLCYGDVED